MAQQNYFRLLYVQKRFFTRGTLRSIGISLNPNPLSWSAELDPGIKKRVDFLNSLYGRKGGGWKTFTVVHKMPRYLLIYNKISFYTTVRIYMQILISTFTTYTNIRVIQREAFTMLLYWDIKRVLFYPHMMSAYSIWKKGYGLTTYHKIATLWHRPIISTQGTILSNWFKIVCL